MNRRNNLRLAKQTVLLRQLLQQAKERVHEFSMHYTTPTPPQVLPSTSLRPPDTSWYKINFDSALFDKENCAGIGIVIRNDKGLVMASLSQEIPLPFTAIKVKALASSNT